MAALRMQGPAGRGWPVRLMVAAGMAAGPALHRGARGMAAAGTAAGSTLVHMTAVAPVAACRTAGTLCGCERYASDERCRRGWREQGIHPRAPHPNLPLPSVVIVTPERAPARKVLMRAGRPRKIFDCLEEAPLGVLHREHLFRLCYILTMRYNDR